jgi:hypothetical protein
VGPEPVGIGWPLCPNHNSEAETESVYSEGKRLRCQCPRHS